MYVRGEEVNRNVFNHDVELEIRTIVVSILPSHLFPESEGRLATPSILPEHLNRGHITRFLSLRPPIPVLVRY